MFKKRKISKHLSSKEEYTVFDWMEDYREIGVQATY